MVNKQILLKAIAWTLLFFLLLMSILTIGLLIIVIPPAIIAVYFNIEPDLAFSLWVLLLVIFGLSALLALEKVTWEN